MIWGLNPIRGKSLTLRQNIQSGSWTHPPSYSVGSGGTFPRGRVMGVWGWSSTSSAKVKNEWSCTFTPVYLHIGPAVPTFFALHRPCITHFVLMFYHTCSHPIPIFTVNFSTTQNCPYFPTSWLNSLQSLIFVIPFSSHTLCFTLPV